MSEQGAKQGGAMRWVLGCGAAALVVGLLVCGCGGWLLWLEEGRELGEPAEEVARAPLQEGRPSGISFIWDGVGYAFNDVWVVVEGEESEAGRFVLEGVGGCAEWRGAAPREEAIRRSRDEDSWYFKRVESAGEGRFKAWVKVGDVYTRASVEPIRCVYTLEASEGRVRSASVVVTRLQRPSDFIAN